MKNYDIMRLKHVSRYLWNNVISFEIYDTIWQVCMWFHLKSVIWYDKYVCDFIWNLWYDMTSMYVISFEIYEMTSMQVWFDKICNGLCYDMKTVPMLWAYCIARSCMLVVHPVCLLYVWSPQPVTTGEIGIYLDSLILTHGSQQWVTSYDK